MKVIFQLKDYAQILIHLENSRLKVEKNVCDDVQNLVKNLLLIETLQAGLIAVKPISYYQKIFRYSS